MERNGGESNKMKRNGDEVMKWNEIDEMEVKVMMKWNEMEWNGAKW